MAVDPVIAPAPKHRVTKADGQCSLIVDLPGLKSLAEVELNIGHTEIQLSLQGGSTSVIALPEEISANSEAHSASAKFSRKRGELSISWTLPGLAAASLQDSDAETSAPLLSETVVENVGARAERAETRPRQAPVSEPRERSAAETGDAPATSQAARADSGQEPAQGGADKPAAAYGSLWNANSWHWESKNCIEILRAAVKQLLDQCMSEKLKHINDLSGASVLLSAISVEGEATFSLRRGKRILYYEISVSFNWEVRDAYGGVLGAKGKGNVVELTQEDDAPQVSVVANTTFSGGVEAKAAGEWMRRHGALEVGKFLMGERLSASVLAMEEKRANADQDAARRKDERAKAEAAQTATADQRERLAVEQRQSEEARRVKPADGAVQGSVWNANAWHWEEKPMTTWAHTWLQRKLEGLTASVLGGLATVTFASPQVSGDASVSVRKGRPIALFQLRLECKWAVAASAAGVGEAQGTLVVPEFTSEDGARGSAIEVQAASSVKKSSGQIIAAIRREGNPVVREVLAQFIDELKQLDRSA